MAAPRLSPTSYVVLGLVELIGPATPYELKRHGQAGVFVFWSIPHTNLYGECSRLRDAGLLAEEREESGRRRRTFSLTPSGREALDGWRGTPSTDVFEVRDEGLAKLYFGADRRALAAAQRESHTLRLQFLRAVHEGVEMPPGMQGALEAGIALEEAFVAFWERLA